MSTDPEKNAKIEDEGLQDTIGHIEESQEESIHAHRRTGHHEHSHSHHEHGHGHHKKKQKEEAHVVDPRQVNPVEDAEDIHHKKEVQEQEEAANALLQEEVPQDGKKETQAEATQDAQSKKELEAEVTQATVVEESQEQPEDNIDQENLLKTIDDWSFDAFMFAKKTKEPIKCLGTYLFTRHGLIEEYNIDRNTLNRFLTEIENGYGRYNNPYHNSVHATDVTHSMHYIITQTGLEEMLTRIEVFAAILGAMIHDYDHSGKTNMFLVHTSAERALVYNDRSVQENHHISATFFLMQNPKTNILKNLSTEDYQYLRSLIIDMVLATDMAEHFQMVKEIKCRLAAKIPPLGKRKILAYLLHSCDLGATVKPWSIHKRFTELLQQEFFSQGDIERRMGLPISPLCDKHATSIPDAQLQFFDFIVEPTMTLCFEMLESVLSRDKKGKVMLDRPWEAHLVENKRKWREQIRTGTFTTFSAWLLACWAFLSVTIKGWYDKAINIKKKFRKKTR